MRKRIIKTGALIFAMIFTAAAITGCSMVKVKQPAKTEDKSKIVASINDIKITRAEFDKNLSVFKSQYEKQVQGVKWEEIPKGQTEKLIDVVKTQLLDMLVQNKIEFLKAKADGITVTPADLTKMTTEAKAYYGGDEGFKKFLAEQHMTDADFQKISTEQIMNEKLRVKLGGTEVASEADAKKYFEANKNSYEEVNADHILVKTEAEAKAIRARVIKGENFNKLAAELSIDPSAKKNKGNLGFFARGAMVPEFETVAFAMKPKEISQPVKTDYGFHIIKVIEKKSAVFADVKGSIIEQITKDKKTAAYEKVMVEFNKTIKIEKFLENLK